MVCCSLVIFGLAVLVFFLVERLLRYLKVGDWCNKHVLVTGCDSGFGQALSLRLDSLGFPVFAGCLTEEGRQFLSDKASSRLVPFILDVTKQDHIHKALDLVAQKLPQAKGLWALVNNAGIAGAQSLVEACTLQDFRTAADVNLFGPIEMCRTFLPLVRRSKGRVVNMISIAGRGSLTASPYCTSKFALEGFTDRLRLEVHEHGVKVCIIEPGFFLTNILNRESMVNSANQAFEAASEEVQQAYGSNFVRDNIKLMDNIRNSLNPDLSPVIRAYTHAITARFPQTRYVIGFDARIISLISFLPAGLGDLFYGFFQKRIQSMKNTS